MRMFSPERIYEEGRRATLANQERFYQRFREQLQTGLVLYLEEPVPVDWFVLAPSTRLEERVLWAQDLAVDGPAGQYRVEFEVVDFLRDTDEERGWFTVRGFPVAYFCILPRCESRELIELWNTRSGRPPVQYIEP